MISIDINYRKNPKKTLENLYLGNLDWIGLIGKGSNSQKKCWFVAGICLIRKVK